MRFIRLLRPTALVGLLPLALAGCSDTPSTEPSMQQRQDAALKDPFSYGPNNVASGSAAPGRPTPEPLVKPTDESLGGEWKRFWNP